MAEAAAAVRSLLPDIERVSAAADSALSQLRTASERAAMDCRSLEQEGEAARVRRERVEEALRLLQEERKATRSLLVRIVGSSESGQKVEAG